jgi:hypothetical protein
MFQESAAHHQEASVCMYIANGTSKMTVSEPGWNVPLHPGLPAVILEVPFATYIHLPPDDGLLMPETCRGILTHCGPVTQICVFALQL